MAILTFEIKICGQKLCAQKDGFRKSGHILSAYLPAVRSTSGRRIGPAISHNTEYRCANTDLLY